MFGVSFFCGSTFIAFLLSRSLRNFILCCDFAKLVQNERDLAQDAGYIARPLYILCRREWLRESWLAICWNRREHVGTAPRASCCRRRASSTTWGNSCCNAIPCCIRLRRRQSEFTQSPISCNFTEKRSVSPFAVDVICIC